MTDPVGCEVEECEVGEEGEGRGHDTRTVSAQLVAPEVQACTPSKPGNFKMQDVRFVLWLVTTPLKSGVLGRRRFSE